MDVGGRTIALYGRFSPKARERFLEQVSGKGGSLLRDLTRRADAFVVGALAAPLIDSGALPTRLRTARDRGVPVLGERGFSAALCGEADPDRATVPIATPLFHTGLHRDDADVLAAFDLITIVQDHCRFGDAGVMRVAAELKSHGRTLGDIVKILTRSRDHSPRGRHKVVLTPLGAAALQWDDGLTTLEGQLLLPLDEAHASIDDLFEAAALAESEGDLGEAARLYDLCARADRSDAIALYNYANVRSSQGASDQAILAYQRALVRDPTFIEARYNLAQAFEAADKPDSAAAELRQVLQADPTYSDALFNLAQLNMKAGDLDAAKSLYQRYLAMGPPEAWAALARKALAYCSQQPA